MAMAPGTITNNHIPLAALQRLPIFCSLQMSISSNSNSYTLHKYLSASQPHNLSQLSAGGSTSNPIFHPTIIVLSHLVAISVERRAFTSYFFFICCIAIAFHSATRGKKVISFYTFFSFFFYFLVTCFCFYLQKSGRLSLLVCLLCLLVYAFMLYDTDLLLTRYPLPDF